MVTAAATANAPAGWARAIAAASGRARYSARCAHASAGAPAGSVPAAVPRSRPGRQRHLDHAGRGDAGQVGGGRDQHRLPGPGGHVPERGDQPQPGQHVRRLGDLVAAVPHPVRITVSCPFPDARPRG